MSPRMKMLRNAAFGVLASAGVLVTYQTSALSQNDAADSSASQAHPHHWGDHGGFGQHPEGFSLGMDGGFGPALRQLNLTDEQKQNVKDIFSAARPDLERIHQSMRSMVDSFRSTMPDDPNYASVVAQATTDSQQLAASMVQEASALRTKVYGVLTAQQKARLPELLKQMQSEHKAHHQRMAPESGTTQ